MTRSAWCDNLAHTSSWHITECIQLFNFLSSLATLAQYSGCIMPYKEEAKLAMCFL